ncbi:hypothetical protein HHI36_001722 [Cryptolaemus montrouzieri]|uniref:Uncharacterized protein n=1 Tax=Cryptolaemus montrouzieri TaxID=559131 RepID=A0ABD2P943_9CUCU
MKNDVTKSQKIKLWKINSKELNVNEIRKKQWCEANEKMTSVEMFRIELKALCAKNKKDYGELLDDQMKLKTDEVTKMLREIGKLKVSKILICRGSSD